METRNIILFPILLIFAILIIISQNFALIEPLDWLYYESVSGWIDVSWQDSFFGFIPVLPYLPTIGGILAILGAILVFLNEKSSKLCGIIGGIITILAFGFFTLFHLIFGLVSTQSFFPNMPGAYICLIPGIFVLILSLLIKKPDFGKGEARVDREYYAIGGEPKGPALPAVPAPSIVCPHCGAMLSADQTFCESCGEFIY